MHAAAGAEGASSWVIGSDGGFLAITNVSKSFGGVAAVRGVNLQIRRGEFFSLLGPSGCGKSTLMRMVAGFETPNTGEIRLDGEDLVTRPPHLRPVNMMFQSYALFPHLSVAENIAFGLKRQGLKGAELGQRLAAMLALVQMEPLAHRKPHELSGGQRQRVALARALARGPKLLLLDEPLGALDKKLRRETQTELKRIQHQTGTTFVIVTHDQEEAMALSDRVAIMRGGEIAQVGAPGEVYDRPLNRFVAAFMGDVNLLPAERFGGAPGFSLAIRPERITLGRPGAEGLLTATITEIIDLGAARSLKLHTDDGLTIEASVPRGVDLPAGLGERVAVRWRSADALTLGD